jgi:hypothetical protein
MRPIDQQTRAALGELCQQLLGTVAENVHDPEYITGRTVAHWGEAEGLRQLLGSISQHVRVPQIVEKDGSTHSEQFIPGVGLIQLSCWPRDYFAEGEAPYLALSFAANEQ